MTDAVLVVGPSWVGDMVMAQALFKTLRNHDESAPIDVLAPGWSLPVIARMPEVRRAIDAQTGHGEFGLGKRRRIGRELRAGGYSRAIVLPRSLKSALIPWFARVPRRTGYRGESRFGLINDMRPLDRSALPTTISRYVALGLPAGERPTTIPQPRLTVDERNRAAVCRRLQLETDRPVIAMLAGAEYGPAKCWPPAHFRKLAVRLIDAGFAVWLLGSAKDRPNAETIATGTAARNLCGDTSLVDAVDLISCSSQAVTNDSGLMHVAAAVGCHVHAIYGSSTPDFTPPATDSADIYYRGLDCSPCFQRQCPLGHLDCLWGIEPERVFDRVIGRSHGRSQS